MKKAKKLRKGMVAKCVGNYMAIKKLEKRQEEKEQELIKWLKVLTNKEFEEYGNQTIRLN